MTMTIRRAWAAVLTAAVMVTTVVSGVVVSATEASAASTSGFDAGMIITDALFYDSNAMTAAQIQTFLNAKVPTCHPEKDKYPETIVCLKDIRANIVAKDAVMSSSGTVLCTAITARSNATAAEIIDTVARACGVSQKVLLVLLQKETGLVTHDWPSPWRYQGATGYGCPDTDVCDSQYYGFYNQVYNASLQFKRYQANPTRYGYVAGQNNIIGYHPKSWDDPPTCPVTSVYITNQATAGLYNYTPYVPDAEALAAGEGEGGGCSSYGNRNFYLFYTDWFGATNPYVVGDKMVSSYTYLGGAAVLGSTTSTQVYQPANGGGYAQAFTNGTLYVRPGQTYSFLRKGSGILNAFVSAGGAAGSWGWPFAMETCRDGLCSVQFQNVIVYWVSGQGAVVAAKAVSEAVYPTWYARGGLSTLGGGTAALVTSTRGIGGSFQEFTNGIVYLPTGVDPVVLMRSGKFTAAYLAADGPSGDWGWPLVEPTCETEGCTLEFSRGTAEVGTDGVVVFHSRFTEGTDTFAIRSGNVFSFTNDLEVLTEDMKLSYGSATDQVLVGDWDGDGVDGLAVRRGNTFYLKNDLTSGTGSADLVLSFGSASDTVLVGDWDGDGVDGLAVRRGNTYYLKNDLASGTGSSDLIISYGSATWAAYVGDWDGDGADSIAVRLGNTYYLKNDLTSKSGSADLVVSYGSAAWTAYAGDWDGDGVDSLAVRSGNSYYLKNDLTSSSGSADQVVTYGAATSTILVGDWDGP